MQYEPDISTSRSWPGESPTFEYHITRALLKTADEGADAVVSACLSSKFLPASLVQISTAKFGAHNTSDNEATVAAERRKGDEKGTKEREAHHNHSPSVSMQSARPPAAHLT